jgi:ankyrin repeat protein
MKEALRRAKRRAAPDSTAVVGFFFSARGNVELQKTPLGLLRTVLHELLQQDDALLSAFLPVFRQKQNWVAGTWYWYQDELQAVLQSAYAANTFPVKKTFIFIDALDECSDGNLDVVRHLVYFLRPLTMDSHLKICLSSRHYPHIKVPDCPEIVLERHNHQDIIHYVDSRLSPWGYDSRAHSLADRVAQKAEGVFLWVVLVIKRLNMVLDNEGTEEDLEESLRTVPKKLEDLFESLFSDFNSQTERQRAVSVVQWVLLAERPLNADEMRHAVGFSQNRPFASMEAWKRSGTGMPEEPERCLISLRGCTRGLVEIKIHPKHQHSRDPSPRRSNLYVPASLPTPRGGVPAKFPIFSEYSGKDRPPERQYGFNAPQAQKVIPKRSSVGRFDTKAPWANENLAELPGSAEDFDSISRRFKSSSPAPLPPVQFIHESVREFFLFGKGFNILDCSTFPKTIADRHCSLMETCIKYISLDEISPSAIESKVLILNMCRPGVQYRFADSGFPFLPYSVNYLFHHALEAERLGKLPQMLVDSLQSKKSQLWKRWVILKNQLHKDGVDAKNYTQYTMRSDRALTSGYTAFHHLCESNLQMCASVLIDRGIDLNSKDTRGYTALHYAIEDGNVGLVRFLASRGADVHARDRSGAAPLHKAARHGSRYSTLRELLQPLLCYKECLDDRDERGLTPLHTAVNWSQEDLVRILLSHGANVHAQDTNGNTPLHLASHIDSKSILLQLVKAGARPDDKNGLGETSLHNAARLRDPQCAISLLQAGASLDAKDNSLCTPLHLRAASGFGLRRFIDSGADVNATTASGKTALDLASERAHWEPVLDLLGSGATTYTGGAARITPLHHAAGRGNDLVVTFWVQAGADVTARTSTGETPLHFAARSGNLACVKTLVNAGSGLNVEDAKGRTPLDHATDFLFTNSDYIRFMESKGCKRVLKMVGGTLRRILEPPP